MIHDSHITDYYQEGYYWHPRADDSFPDYDILINKRFTLALFTRGWIDAQQVSCGQDKCSWIDDKEVRKLALSE